MILDRVVEKTENINQELIDLLALRIEAERELMQFNDDAKLQELSDSCYAYAAEKGISKDFLDKLISLIKEEAKTNPDATKNIKLYWSLCVS